MQCVVGWMDGEMLSVSALYLVEAMKRDQLATSVTEVER